MAVSDRAWSTFSQADYSLAQWHRACLLHRHTGPITSKGQDGLPVREPGGTINRNGAHAAASALAGGRGGVSGSPEQKRSAARQLVSIYRNSLREAPPDSLVRMASR